MKTERIAVVWVGVFLIFSMMAMALLYWYFGREPPATMAYFQGFFTCAGLIFMMRGLE